MPYQRKISDQQSEKLRKKLEEQMHVLEAGNVVIKAQVKVLMDILIENNIATQKEIEDRSEDTLYTVLSLAKLI